MLFSYNFLQSFFEEKLPSADDLGNLLMMHFFEVEEVKKVDGDYVLDIDILSSRAGDCLSHIGIAREIGAVTGFSYKIKERKVKEVKEELQDKVSVSVREACNRYTLRGVDNVKVGPSPQYIQKILKSCGINPINNIVDITNYVMLETGQPLHAFDADKLSGEKITVRYAKKREKIVTLDEKRYELPDNVLVISDELSPIGIAGIKGGIVPEVDEDTKTVYIEAGNFDPLIVRRGSRDIKLRTDASLRFEHGISQKLTEIAVNRAASMMADIAKGDVLKGMIDYRKEEKELEEIDFNVDNLRELLGVDIPIKDIERILRSLEFNFKRDDSVFYVIPPFFRRDVVIKEDIFEEIGRVYGYDKIEPVFPKEKIKTNSEDDFFRREMQMRGLWKEMLYNEVYNYSFINEELSLFFNKKSLIEVEKPVSLEFKYLRPSLFPLMLRSIKSNENNYDDINIFELGSVFYKEKDKETEKKMLAVASNSDDFYTLKGKVNRFLKECSLVDVCYKEEDEILPFAKGSLAKIVFKNQTVGLIGKINSEILSEMKIDKKVTYAEFDVDVIAQYFSEVKVYEEIYRVPPSIRDVAVLVPEKESYENVLEEIKKTGGKLLRDVELFDFYKGKGIPENKKSFAFRLYFQLKDKTLSSKEVNELQDKIIKNIDSKNEWSVRK